MLRVAAVHRRHDRLAAANPRTSSVPQTARGCRAETRSKESSKVKTGAPEIVISRARIPAACT